MTEVERRPPPDFEEWWKEAGPELLTLLQDTVHSGEDFFEDFLDVSLHIRDRWKKKAAGLPEDRLLNFFVREWFRRQKLKRQEWEEDVLLAALFGLGWNFRRISLIMNMGESRISMRAFESLMTLGEVGHSPHLAKDCARNDLHIIDVLTGRAWPDPLRVYARDDFEAHRKSCSRCAGLYQQFSRSAAALAARRRDRVPERLSAAMEHATTKQGVWNRLAAPFRMDWYYRVPIQLTVAAAVVLCVIALPYVGELLPKKAAKVEEEVASLPPPSGESPPLPAPSEKIQPTVDFKAVMDRNFPLARLATRQPPSLDLALPPTVRPQDLPTLPKTPTTQPQPKPKPSPVVVAAKVNATKPVEPKPAKAVGLRSFFRWGARAQDPDLMASRVQRMLQNYAATRAGELEWGAFYRGGRYFHFTLKQEDYARFQNELRGMEFSAFTAEEVESDREEAPNLSRIVFWIGPSP